MGRLLAALVVAAALGLAGAPAAQAGVNVFIGSSTIPTMGGDASQANLWMDTNGGSCVRQAVAGAYVDASACDSWDEAYAAASCGDTVRMVDGSTYTGYTNGAGGLSSSNEGIIDGRTKGCSLGTFVTFDGGVGVTAGGLDWTDTDSIRIKDVTLGGETPANNVDKVVDLTGDENMELDDANVDAQWGQIDAVGYSGGNADILWKNSYICCNLNQKLLYIDDFAHVGTQQTDITFEDMVIRDEAFSQTDGRSPIDGQPVHAECTWAQNTTRLTFRRTVVKNCISSGEMNWGGDGLNQSLLFQNTVWGPSFDFGSTEVVPGPVNGYRGAQVGVGMQGANTSGTGTVEYSVFRELVTISGWSSLTWRGNIDSQTTCPTPTTYLYNRHEGADCSASDVQDASALSSGRFVNLAGDDYTPAPGSAQIDAGDPASCPTPDLLGHTRPLGGICDQGPIEGG